MLFSVFYITNKKTVYQVLINHIDPKGCKKLYWDGHYYLCSNMSFSLRKLSNNKFYSCLKSCVYFRSEEELKKHLELCSVQSKKYEGKKPSIKTII